MNSPAKEKRPKAPDSIVALHHSVLQFYLRCRGGCKSLYSGDEAAS